MLGADVNHIENHVQRANTMTDIRAIVAGIILLYVVPLPAHADETSDVKQAYTRGRELFEAGNLTGAIPYLEEVYRLAPDYQSVDTLLLKAYRFVGIACYSENRHEDAISMWQRALRIDPDNQEVLGYVKRARLELSQIGRLLDSTSGSQTHPPAAETSDRVDRKPAVLSPEKSRIAPESAGTVVRQEGLGSTFDIGVALGLAVRTTDARYRPPTGWHLVGDVSYVDDHLPVRLKVDAAYARLFQRESIAGQSRQAEHLSIFGGQLSGLACLYARSHSRAHLSIGFGVYEVIRSRYNDELVLEVPTRVTSTGFGIGTGWRQNVGRMAVTVDARYLHLSTSLSPDLLLLSVGVATN